MRGSLWFHDRPHQVGDRRRGPCDRQPVQGLDDTGDCGASSPGELTTDKYGQAFLRFWSPGLLYKPDVPVKVDVTATKCPATGCSHNEEKGSRATALKLIPRLVYHQVATLSDENADILIDLGKSTSLHQFLVDLPKNALKIFNLLYGEEEAQLGKEAADHIFEHLAEKGSEEWEQQLNEALFMAAIWKPPVPDIGLGNPKQSTVAGFFDHNFLEELAASEGYFTISPSMLFKYGQTLDRLKNENGGVLPPQTVDLTIYEVSYCNEAASTDCGPNYSTHDGIQPYLYSDFHSQISSENHTFTYYVLTPYDAQPWLKALAKEGG